MVAVVIVPGEEGGERGGGRGGVEGWEGDDGLAMIKYGRRVMRYI